LQDPDAGLVLTVDGRKFEGDVVVGADGIRSIARRYVTGSDAGPVPVGESVYRLFVKRDDLLAAKHPLVKSGEISRGCVIIKGPQRKIVAYPIRDGSLLTLVCYVRKSARLHSMCFVILKLF
jgi:salicylate hydroxylase